MMMSVNGRICLNRAVEILAEEFGVKKLIIVGGTETIWVRYTCE